MTTRLMYEISKRKEKEPQGEDATMAVRQNKENNLSLLQGIRTCLSCGELGHITRFCNKMKNKERENAKNVKNDDDFTFEIQHEAHLRSVYKWIMDLEATKHIILYRAAFDTYEVISLDNVRLDNDGVVETIGVRSIVINVEMKGKTNKFCIMNVLHMLKLQANSLLVSKLLLNEMKM